MEWREPDETADSRRGGSLEMEFGLEAEEARELTIELRKVESRLSPRALPFDAF